MQEKTERGYIGKISKQNVQQAYGATKVPPSVVQPATKHQAPILYKLSPQHEIYSEVTLQGYTGMMAMQQEVKRVHEARLAKREQPSACRHECRLKLSEGRVGAGCSLFSRLRLRHLC